MVPNVKFTLNVEYSIRKTRIQNKCYLYVKFLLLLWLVGIITPLQHLKKLKSVGRYT